VMVHANPWVLDTLRDSDYYIQKEKGYFLYDQAEKVILHHGDSLMIPDSSTIATIHRQLKSTIIDLNIPQFTLRLIQLHDTILTCQVRVGRNEDKYLPLVGRVVDLRTPIGKGEIVKIERIPVYRNPETGEQYELTRRDDGRTTKMPIIPSLEPAINNIRYGKVIHATTNPQSLGKAYSHGCIGMAEANAWTIYYNAPLGTKVVYRYDLKVRDLYGDTILLKDIYHRNQR
jgi:L,D-transpeptidase ErfK/SrfK